MWCHFLSDNEAYNFVKKVEKGSRIRFSPSEMSALGISAGDIIIIGKVKKHRSE